MRQYTEIMAVASRVFDMQSNEGEVRRVVVNQQDKERMLARLPVEIRDIVALADNIFDSEEIVAKMVEQR
jgi:hypothetical protein